MPDRGSQITQHCAICDQVIHPGTAAVPIKGVFGEGVRHADYAICMDAAGVLELCPDCGALISRDVRGGLLPHHPGLNAGTPKGGGALCPGGRTAYIEGDKLVIRDA